MSVFTELAEIAERTYLENELAFAVLGNMPITPGHTLIIPRREVATWAELMQDELGAIHELSVAAMAHLKEVFGAEGFNCAWNQGEKYGQSVPHFHLHIVPRTPGDSGITAYEPRQFLYRPGERQTSPEAELAAITQRLRRANVA